MLNFIFSLPTSVAAGDKSYSVRTDFRVILEIFVMLDDPDLTDADKTAALLRMFYVNRPPDAEAALRAFTDFVDPRHGNQGKKPPGRLIDWSQDFDLMVAPINHILGFECRAADYLHWRTFLAAYLEIPPESVFARVLRIREKLRTGKKLEKNERTWYHKNRDLVHLKPKFSKAEEAILSEWA
ncbi:MAG: hypothetical protein J5916_06005 [Oscillospiraceae bacterium]|nr:hypothetical protein [Oscillospiraceae bacterium]